MKIFRKTITKEWSRKIHKNVLSVLSNKNGNESFRQQYDYNKFKHGESFKNDIFKRWKIRYEDIQRISISFLYFGVKRSLNKTYGFLRQIGYQKNRPVTKVLQIDNQHSKFLFRNHVSKWKLWVIQDSFIYSRDENLRLHRQVIIVADDRTVIG